MKVSLRDLKNPYKSCWHLWRSYKKFKQVQQVLGWKECEKNWAVVRNRNKTFMEISIQPKLDIFDSSCLSCYTLLSVSKIQWKYLNFYRKSCTKIVLVESAGKCSMLHPCMHSNFLINTENTESTHGQIMYGHNAASTISNKTTVNISTYSPSRSLCFSM